MRLKINRFFKDENGSGLVLALMVLLVLSVLGSALGVATVGSYRLGDINQDNTSAYYIAEAGANMAYEEIKEVVQEEYEDLDSVSDETFYNNVQPVITGFEKEYSDSFELQSGENPSATVTISGPIGEGEERQYTIKSTGKVAKRERTVEKTFTVTWTDKETEKDNGESLNFPKDAAIIVKEQIDFGNNKNISINGEVIGDTDVKVEGTNNNNFGAKERELNWDSYTDILKELPDMPIKNSIGNWVIETNGQTVNYKVNSFNFKNDTINITGGGTVNIFLESPFDTSSFNDSNRITNIMDGKLNIIYTGSDSLIFGSDALGEFILFAPNAPVELKNGVVINGSIIAKRVTLKQNSQVLFPDGLEYDFSFGVSPELGDEIEEKDTELISTTPAIEQ